MMDELYAQLKFSIISIKVQVYKLQQTSLEQKRKLFHTSVYDSEVQLKKLYVQTCKRLPCYGCKVYQVKELLRGKTKKKTARLLGLGPEKFVLLDNKTKILAKAQNTADLLQWRTGGGRSHDRLQLEFRGSRWQLAVPTAATMREVGLALWEILQELQDACSSAFLDDLLPPSPGAAPRREDPRVVKRSLHTLQVPVVYAGELESLQKLLHFPEEVALRLTATEHQLFYQVPPIDYLRQVTLDLAGQGGAPGAGTSAEHPTAGVAAAACAAATATATASSTAARPSVKDLIKRFNEAKNHLNVSSWVTHLIITQPTHEDRKAVLSCILRVALSCWNMANFNGAMEIVAGLNKLKPFWLSITEKEAVPVLDFLSAALLSAEYERALARALAMPECRVVPFFGAFLRELRDIVANTPSLVVLAPPGAGETARLE
ncbi:hypothetical protein B566_EDAN005115, partial [Ephemera danica]